MAGKFSLSSRQCDGAMRGQPAGSAVMPGSKLGGIMQSTHLMESAFLRDATLPASAIGRMRSNSEKRVCGSLLHL